MDLSYHHSYLQPPLLISKSHHPVHAVVGGRPVHEEIAPQPTHFLDTVAEAIVLSLLLQMDPGYRLFIIICPNSSNNDRKDESKH